MWQKLNITILNSNRHIVTVKSNGKSYKLFQIIFHKDGSIFVDFPYFKDSQWIISECCIPSGNIFPKTISLKELWKVTSHNVKYSHHTDWETHFSQDWKIYTNIRKKSVPLEIVRWHLFTINIQWVKEFTEVTSVKDKNWWDEKRMVVDYEINENFESLKFVWRWYKLSECLDGFESKEWGNTIWPIIWLPINDGKIVQWFMLWNTNYNLETKYFLHLSCEIMPWLNKDLNPLLHFIWWFDQIDVVNNLEATTSFLALSYPIENFQELEKEIWSIDFI